MQRQKEDLSAKKRKTHHEGPDFKHSVNEAAAAYRLGQGAEQEKQFQEAYRHYNRVLQELKQFPMTKWRRSEFRLAMDAIECIAQMIENGCLPDDQLQVLANNAYKIYHVSPGIQCFDFRLTALRMLITRYGIQWDEEVLTNAVAPPLTREKAEIIEEGLLKLKESIQKEKAQTVPQQNARLAKSARCFILLGNAYLYLAQHNKAISSYLNAMQELASMTIKDPFYIKSLYVIFHHLNMHINIDQFENQYSDLNKVKLSIWQAFNMNPVTPVRFPPALEQQDIVAVSELLAQAEWPPLSDYGQNGQVMPDFLDDSSFYGNNDFMFFNSSPFSSPRREERLLDLDSDITPSKDAKGFPF